MRWLVLASPIPYDTLDDDALAASVLVAGALVVVMAGLGVVAWVRYRRAHRAGAPGPRPWVLVALVLAVSLVVGGLFAWRSEADPPRPTLPGGPAGP